MAKKSKSPLLGLIGGNKAAKVNPLGLHRKYKAICVTHHVVLSPVFRDSEEEALQDTGSHTGTGHFIDFEIKIE